MSYDPFKFMEMLGRGDKISERTTALRVENDKYTVDTCECFDTGKWETGIDPHNRESWVIVEDYNNKDEAVEGHAKWVKLMEQNPNMKLKSIQLWSDNDDEE